VINDVEPNRPVANNLLCHATEFGGFAAQSAITDFGKRNDRACSDPFDLAQGRWVGPRVG
jgi:hypothetical protein